MLRALRCMFCRDFEGNKKGESQKHAFILSNYVKLSCRHMRRPRFELSSNALDRNSNRVVRGDPFS